MLQWMWHCKTHQRRSQTVGRFLAPNATLTAAQQQLQLALHARLHPGREPMTTEIHRGGQLYQNQEPAAVPVWGMNVIVV